MACDVRGNDDESGFTVQSAHGDGVFDRVECAIPTFARCCDHCAGHGGAQA